ncbi:iron ABC transporter permease [Haemophilus influenzae 2019]|nr:putative ABC-type chelated iron transport system, permease component [Haemophilus influenzae PittEE]AIT68088.1 iron ABC transporter permease [Haemophilus influenzae]AKA47276.1 iron ABC transporter permease [Haemophilus influenzae 2019]EDK07727.1 putative ABC-type chelated iron transport system, permease component [Haemophilus influenzae PittAA]EEP47019.1 putative ABC-type chelated iron transport system, permease component [Haemophilus influenzae 7P49H1]EEP47849.1 putative ABC-type chelated 
MSVDFWEQLSEKFRNSTAIWFVNAACFNHCKYDASGRRYFGGGNVNCVKNYRTYAHKSFDKMLWIAIISSIISSLIGVILSYHFDASTGACIILLQATFFVIALAYSKIRTR